MTVLNMKQGALTDALRSKRDNPQGSYAVQSDNGRLRLVCRCQQLVNFSFMLERVKLTLDKADPDIWEPYLGFSEDQAMAFLCGLGISPFTEET